MAAQPVLCVLNRTMKDDEEPPRKRGSDKTSSSSKTAKVSKKSKTNPLRAQSDSEASATSPPPSGRERRAVSAREPNPSPLALLVQKSNAKAISKDAQPVCSVPRSGSKNQKRHRPTTNEVDCAESLTSDDDESRTLPMGTLVEESAIEIASKHTQSKGLVQRSSSKSKKRDWKRTGEAGFTKRLTSFNDEDDPSTSGIVLDDTTLPVQSATASKTLARITAAGGNPNPPETPLP